jgi:hypothetical protein
LPLDQDETVSESRRSPVPKFDNSPAGGDNKRNRKAMSKMSSADKSTSLSSSPGFDSFRVVNCDSQSVNNEPFNLKNKITSVSPREEELD